MSEGGEGRGGGGSILLVQITIRRGVLQSVRLRFIQNLVKHLLRVEHLSPHIGMGSLQSLDALLHLLVEARQRQRLQIDRLLSLADGERGPLDRGDVQQHKVPGAAGVQLLDDAEVLVHELVVEDIEVLVPVAVADVVDADPEREETVGGFPWCERRLGAQDWEEETLDLVLEREHGWHPRRDQV